MYLCFFSGVSSNESPRDNSSLRTHLKHPAQPTSPDTATHIDSAWNEHGLPLGYSQSSPTIQQVPRSSHTPFLYPQSPHVVFSIFYSVVGSLYLESAS